MALVTKKSFHVLFIYNSRLHIKFVRHLPQSGLAIDAILCITPLGRYHQHLAELLRLIPSGYVSAQTGRRATSKPKKLDSIPLELIEDGAI